MTGKLNRPPPGQAWIWLTAEMMKSDAWRTLSLNSRRFVDFLMIGFMEHGGRNNGALKAPHHHLYEFGIGAHYVTAAIAEAEQHGLVEVHRGGLRVATTYTLTWLPLHDESPASNLWRDYQTTRTPRRRRVMSVKVVEKRV